MIKYIGSKRELIPWIMEVVGRIDGAAPLRSAADPFSGSTRVARAFKKAGLHVAASDITAYGFVLARALVAADARRYPPERLAPLLSRLADQPPVEGFITRTYCRDSRFFHPDNGRRIDAARAALDDVADGDPMLRDILLCALMLAADRVDSTTGVQMAYLKQWASRALKPLELRPPALLPGAGEARQADALDVVRSLDVDLLYLDPPYNQHAYLSNYHLWETLVLSDDPEVYGVACKRIDCRERKSPFNSKRRAADAMARLLAEVRARHVLLSFSDEGHIDGRELERMLAAHAPVSRLSRPHRRYVGARIGIYNPKGQRVGRVSHLRNREFLYLSSPDPRVHAAVAELADASPRAPVRTAEVG